LRPLSAVKAPDGPGGPKAAPAPRNNSKENEKMRKGKWMGFTLLAALAAASLPAFAAEKAGAKRVSVPQVIHLLKQADANGDGQVTFEEVSAKFPKVTRDVFEKMDRNDDGVLTRADIPARGLRARLQRLREALAAADANGDGSVTLEEALTVPRMTEGVFNRLDRNDDGVLNREDVPGRLQQTDGERAKQ